MPDLPEEEPSTSITIIPEIPSSEKQVAGEVSGVKDEREETQEVETEKEETKAYVYRQGYSIVSQYHRPGGGGRERCRHRGRIAKAGDRRILRIRSADPQKIIEYKVNPFPYSFPTNAEGLSDKTAVLLCFVSRETITTSLYV